MNRTDIGILKDGIGTKVIPFSDLPLSALDLIEGLEQELINPCLVLKYGFVDKEDHEEGENDEVVSIISTETPDREKDIILSSGWKLKDYRKIPTVLFGHDYFSLPIGKGRVWVDKDKKALFGATTYLDHEFARDVRNADVKKVVGSSVGFIPLDFANREIDEEEKDPGPGTWLGTMFKRQILLEYSKVPIPCNPECLTLGVKAFGGDKSAIEELRVMVRDLSKNRTILDVGSTLGEKELEDGKAALRRGNLAPVPIILREKTMEDKIFIQMDALLETVEELLSETVIIRQDVVSLLNTIKTLEIRFGPKSPYADPKIGTPSEGGSQKKVELRRLAETAGTVARRISTLHRKGGGNNR